ACSRAGSTACRSCCRRAPTAQPGSLPASDSLRPRLLLEARRAGRDVAAAPVLVDVHQRLPHVAGELRVTRAGASQRSIVFVGRLATVVTLVVPDMAQADRPRVAHDTGKDLDHDRR